MPAPLQPRPSERIRRAPGGTALILAAGRARRFGSDKRRHRLADGRTLLETTLAAYRAVFPQPLVVLRPEDAAWAARLAGALPVYAQDADLGMAHSLAAGVRAARHFNFLFIALGDMPSIQPATLRRLQAAMTGPERIVRPSHRGASGHPVGFGQAHYDALERLTGDQGAKSILQAHRDKVLAIPVDDPGVLQDIDAPPQLENSAR